MKIVNAIRNLGLEISNLRGRGYDGAGNMAGKKSGVSSRILKLNDIALYVHCFNHRLNLVIAKSCNIQKVRNLMGIIKAISYFLNLSPKREQFLKDVKKLFDLDTVKEKLIDVCLTRWVARIDGLVVFETFFTIIIYVLEKMKDNANPDIHFNDDTSTKASNLYKSCYNFDFVVALVITSAVTELLQKKSNDILQAYQLIESVKAQFHDIRTNVDIFHEEWYKVALELAEKIQLQESMPRSCNRQVHRDNQPHSNCSEYYKYSITIPLVDHVAPHLQSYFSRSNITVINGFILYLMCYIKQIIIMSVGEKKFGFF